MACQIYKKQLNAFPNHRALSGLYILFTYSVAIFGAAFTQRIDHIINFDATAPIHKDEYVHS